MGGFFGCRRFRLMRRLAACVIAAACVVGLQPSQALAGDSAYGDSKRDKAWLAQWFAHCIAGRRPELAKQWLYTIPASQDELNLLKKYEIDLSACVGSYQIGPGPVALSSLLVTLRHDVAIDLLKRRHPDLPNELPVQSASRPWFDDPSYVAVSANTPPQGVMIDAFGFCVAKSDWPGTIALLRTKPDSQEEVVAIQRVSPLFGGCLPTKMTLTIKRAQLRGVLAEAVYHMIEGPADRNVSTATVSQAR